MRSYHVQRVTAANLKPILNHNIEYGARIMTDSGTVLHGAIHPRQHDQVNHTAKEYDRYENGVCITTNTVEGFFSLLKRGINGTYHHVGASTFTAILPSSTSATTPARSAMANDPAP